MSNITCCGVTHLSLLILVFALPLQEDLVALWDDDDESNDETVDDKMQETPAVPSKPQIDKLWHRVTEDRMVVGVMLTTDTAV